MLRHSSWASAFLATSTLAVLVFVAWAQPPGGPPMPLPGGPQPPNFFVFGGPMGQERKILKDFDADGDGILNKEERQKAREQLKREPRRGPRGFGPPGGFGGPGRSGEAPKPGPRVNVDEVSAYPDRDLFDPAILRTLFLEFENPDWEAELEDFHNTDVEVPCTLTVDGKSYPNVGVHFRGMSSYTGVPAGYKRSLNLSLDLVDPKQRLYGYKTLNLLNGHQDASFMSTVLYSHLARKHMAAPKANFVKVVINGESWGVYANAQQFDKIFLGENFKSSKGARWKVSGSPGAAGGLEYLGEDINEYRRRYEIKSDDKEESWQSLIQLCKVLNQTPLDQLEAALRPILDVDGLLWFLALDIGLINTDGYWIRSSDYCIARDDKGVFHIVPHDMNESFRPAGGLGMGGPDRMMIFQPPRPMEILPSFVQDQLRLTPAQRRQLAELQKAAEKRIKDLLDEEQRAELKRLNEFGPTPIGGPPPVAGGPPPGPVGPFMRPDGLVGGGGSGVELDPLHGLDDPRKPLRSKILAVPSLRSRYLANLRTLAQDDLDWKTLGPVVKQYRELVAREVEGDTRKMTSYQDFLRATNDAAPGDSPPPMARGPHGSMNLRAFAEQRRQYLLNHPEIKKLDSVQGGKP